MIPLDVEGLRAKSLEPLPTRRRPVDLICKKDGAELTIRTKLARDPESAAVCIAEAVAHALLAAVGFRMAEPFSVVIGEEFARDLTTQYDFDAPVRPGRHWGTRLMRTDVQEIEFVSDMIPLLADPGILFDLYLADVVLGNPDRATYGNVLLASRAGSTTRFDLIPIDQSECFFHPSSMIDANALHRHRSDSGAIMLDGMERVVLDKGQGFVIERFEHMDTLKGRMHQFVAACTHEWYSFAGVTPSLLEQFLEHRAATLHVLARKEHWLGIASYRGEYALDFA